MKEKNCRKCIFHEYEYSSYDSTITYDICKHKSSHIHLSSTAYWECDRIRNDENKCGKEGKYFKPSNSIKLIIKEIKSSIDKFFIKFAF